jgi:hypothetical protein
VTNLAHALKPGGYGVFQAPTYRPGYKFSVGSYLNALADPAAPRHIEMHLLPKSRAFRLIHDAGCVLVDVFEDDWAGSGFESHTFVVHKPVP